jgi:hypothetical protein
MNVNVDHQGSLLPVFDTKSLKLRMDNSKLKAEQAHYAKLGW